MADSTEAGVVLLDSDSEDDDIVLVNLNPLKRAKTDASVPSNDASLSLAPRTGAERRRTGEPGADSQEVMDLTEGERYIKMCRFFAVFIPYMNH